MKNLAITILIVFSLVNVFGQKEDDCVFDTNTQTDDFLKKIPEFSNYKWNDEKKEAIVKLDTGDILIVSRGGCCHFGFYGTLEAKKNKIDFANESKIFSKALWIAEKLFHKSQSEYFKQKLKNKEYSVHKDKNKYILTFIQDNYCSMTLVVEKIKDSVTICIGFYQC